MAEYFWIRKQADSTENYCNLISNSIPSKNGTSGGYVYRPAIRMQFVPFCGVNTTGVRFYPNKITIMRRTDYNCDVTNDNTTVWVPVDGSWSSSSSSTIETQLDTDIVDNAETPTQHGIIFNQIVAYQELYFKFDLAVVAVQEANGTSVVDEYYLQETVSCCQDWDFSNNPLYQCVHYVAKISDLTAASIDDSKIDNKCQLKYVAKANDSQKSPVYATVYRNKQRYIDFVNNNSITGASAITHTFRITVAFSNFKSTNSFSIDYVEGTQWEKNNAKRTLQFYDCSTSVNTIKGTWVDDGDFSYYTRVQKDTSGFTDQKLSTDNTVLYQQASSVGVSYEDFTTASGYFAPNTKNTAITTNKKFVFYWDYLKYGSDGKYLVNGSDNTNGIDNYLDKEVIFKVDFKVESNSATQVSVCYYKYAFSNFIDNKNRPGNKISLRKIFGQNGYLYRQFEINGKTNVQQDVGNILFANGLSKFIKDPQYLYCNAVMTTEGRACKYRYSQKPFDADADDAIVKWLQIDDFSGASEVKDANIKIIFGSHESNDSIRQIYLQIADNQFNYSKVVMANMQIYTTPPQSLFLKIVGTNGNQNYTGVEINSVNGQFGLDDAVQIQFSASTPNPQVQLYYSITGDIYDQYITEITEGSNTSYTSATLSDFRQYDANDNFKIVYLKPLTQGINQAYTNNFYESYQSVQDGVAKTKRRSIYQGCLNAHDYNDITITFKDDAGNVSQITQRIYYNTVVFKAQHKNLRQASASYDLQLYKSVNNANTLINRTDNSQAKTYRKWNDIFYPSNHSYPTKINGQIDEDLALKISKDENYDVYRQQYDQVRIENNQIVKDTQGRVESIWNPSKKYPTMVSSYDDLKNQGTGFTYWIIDNTSYGDITLNFEYFYLDNVAYGPPYNQMLGKNTPDVLAVYDASAEGCVQQYNDEYGNIKYKLKDTTKLKRLQRYTGYGTKTMSIDTGTVNASDQGAFTTESFGTERICLIFYSDCMNSNNATDSVIGSGFKLKAAKQIVQYWQNFDIDVNNGLIWTHLSAKASSDGKTPGQAVTKAALTYDYYNTSVKIDYQNGAVIFDEKPDNDVYASYIYYDYGKDDMPPSRDFMTNADDLVDYADLNVYFVNKGVKPNKINNVNPAPIYPNKNTGEQVSYSDGKLNNNYSVDKDRGIIQFNDASGKDSNYNQFTYVPRGRLFADYRYHTFLRLGNDGYSDFEFHDLILVADKTTKYPDYTWGDIKIVNQGDASLQAGQIKFLARGVVESNNTVTQVLDINRPWDVQMGSAQETYGKTGCVIKTHYTWDSYSCTIDQAKAILGSSVVNRFNVDEFKPRGVMYGRIVICLGGTNDSYPTTTAGRKVFSSEIAGKYYQEE